MLWKNNLGELLFPPEKRFGIHKNYYCTQDIFDPYSMQNFTIFGLVNNCSL